MPFTKSAATSSAALAAFEPAKPNLISGTYKTAAAVCASASAVHQAGLPDTTFLDGTPSTLSNISKLFPHPKDQIGKCLSLLLRAIELIETVCNEEMARFEACCEREFAFTPDTSGLTTARNAIVSPWNELNEHYFDFGDQITPEHRQLFAAWVTHCQDLNSLREFLVQLLSFSLDEDRIGTVLNCGFLTEDELKELRTGFVLDECPMPVPQGAEAATSNGVMIVSARERRTDAEDSTAPTAHQAAPVKCPPGSLGEYFGLGPKDRSQGS